jgi:carbon-monoxide dehydrogenase medium subunit
MSLEAHPALPEFDYVRPANLAEACQFLAQHPDTARPFLGGTDVFVRMRDGFWKPKFLVDVKRLDDMQTLRYDPQEGFTLGAAVNMNRVAAAPEVQAHYPLLAEACRWVASYQLRSRATIVGNLCNASPAGDTTGACLVLDGRLRVHGVGGCRWEPLTTFFLGPGKTTLKPGDVVTAIQFPPPPPGAAGTYLKLGRNRLSDLAIVGVTVLGYPLTPAPLPPFGGGDEEGAASGFRFRIALASVAPVPLRAAAAEEYLAAHPLDAEAIRAAAKLAAEACSPIDDVRGGAQYRRSMVCNLTRKGLEKISNQLSVNREQ